MGWIQHGEIAEDDGDVGGDMQIGPARSVRFVDPGLPGCLITVYVYAVAQELSLDDQPECMHPAEIEEDFGDGTARYKPSPPEHLACSYDMGNVDLQMQTEFMICRDVDDPGSTEEWSEYQYDYVDDRPPYTGTIPEILAAANAAALQEVQTFDADKYITWDGKPFRR